MDKLVGRTGHNDVSRREDVRCLCRTGSTQRSAGGLSDALLLPARDMDDAADTHLSARSGCGIIGGLSGYPTGNLADTVR